MRPSLLCSFALAVVATPSCMTCEAVDWASPEVMPIVNAYGQGFGETLFVDVKNVEGLDDGVYAVRLFRTTPRDTPLGRLSRIGERSPQFFETPEPTWTPFSIIDVSNEGQPTGYAFSARSRDGVSVWRTEDGRFRLVRWTRDEGSDHWTEVDRADVGQGLQSHWRSTGAWAVVPLAVIGDVITLPIQLLFLPFGLGSEDQDETVPS
jgi:hypothetical protein